MNSELSKDISLSFAGPMFQFCVVLVQWYPCLSALSALFSMVVLSGVQDKLENY